MKHTAIYSRVSTIDQDHASQEQQLQAWTSSAAAASPVIWYRDKFTGRTMDRPGINQMLADLQAGRLERIVVWRLDRLGRTAKGLCELFEQLRTSGVDLVSLRDGFTLSTPAGRLQAQILASVAEYETEVRAERVRAGQVAARAAGKRWGGSKPGRLHTVTHEQIEAIKAAHARGEKLARVARATGLSRPTIYRLVKQHCI